MQECNFPSRVLIQRLSFVRPGQIYWPERDQFVLALVTLDKELATYFYLEVHLV